MTEQIVDAKYAVFFFDDSVGTVVGQSQAAETNLLILSTKADNSCLFLCGLGVEPVNKINKLVSFVSSGFELGSIAVNEPTQVYSWDIRGKLVLSPPADAGGSATLCSPRIQFGHSSAKCGEVRVRAASEVRIRTGAYVGATLTAAVGDWDAPGSLKWLMLPEHIDIITNIRTQECCIIQTGLCVTFKHLLSNIQAIKTYFVDAPAGSVFINQEDQNKLPAVCIKAIAGKWFYCDLA